MHFSTNVIEFYEGSLELISCLLKIMHMNIFINRCDIYLDSSSIEER